MANAEPQPLVKALRGSKPPPDTDAVRNMVTALNSKSKANGSTRSIQVIRHGATALNNDDVSVDRIRGWKDVPLSPQGKEEAHKLAGKVAKEPPDNILSSDLKRAHDTAKVIAEKAGVPIVSVTEAFRPWNVGEYSGQVTSKAIPILGDYAKNKPDETVPGGESFNDFKGRFLGGLKQALDEYPGKLAVVTHHRGERLLNAWGKAGYPENGDIDVNEFNKKGEHTGSVTNMDIPHNKLEQAG